MDSVFTNCFETYKFIFLSGDRGNDGLNGLPGRPGLKGEPG